MVVASAGAFMQEKHKNGWMNNDVSLPTTDHQENVFLFKARTLMRLSDRILDRKIYSSFKLNQSLYIKQKKSFFLF